VAESAIRARPAAPASIMPTRLGDIGEEITEIELEPLPEEVPAEVPAAPATEPTPA
jgi:hypothetical protein